MAKVSVIIPVYNVGAFVGKCAESLMNQTLDDVQYIFVDDHSPDNSAEIISSVVSRFSQRNVTILTHEENKGLPAARNTGLAFASGEYIFHCDGDDFLEPDSLKSMYDLAKAEYADMVYCDFFLTYEKSERVMSNPDYETGYKMVCEGFMTGRMKYNVWNKLARRSLYVENNISFPTGHSMGEDMTMIMLSIHAEKVCHLSRPLYHYIQVNSSAFSRSFSEAHWTDIDFNVNRVCSYLSDKVENAQELVAYFKLSVKWPFLITRDTKQYTLWRGLYSEADKYILVDRTSPLRVRLVQWCAWKRMDGVVWLYNFLLYGIIGRILNR